MNDCICTEEIRYTGEALHPCYGAVKVNERCPWHGAGTRAADAHMLEDYTIEEWREDNALLDEEEGEDTHETQNGNTLETRRETQRKRS